MTLADAVHLPSDNVQQVVTDYYSRVLKTSNDLKTSACTSCGPMPKVVREALAVIPGPVVDKFYGCGNPIPPGNLTGLTVVDLGCGSGRDVYVCAKLVGPSGKVIGVDMTESQLETAKEHVQEFGTKIGFYPQMDFVLGQIEDLRGKIDDASADIVISNCVVNLSPAKDRVLSEVYRILKPGGEFYFSDVYCDRRLPDSARIHPVLLGECIGGALYLQDFKRLCRSVGFLDPRVVSSSEIKVQDPELATLVGDAKFMSITFRLFKLENMEDACEDYGQVVIYKGPEESFELDRDHTFKRGEETPVCGNTASMVSETWFKGLFEVLGDRSVHRGLFDCSKGVSSEESKDTDAQRCVGGGCC